MSKTWSDDTRLRLSICNYHPSKKVHELSYGLTPLFIRFITAWWASIINFNGGSARQNTVRNWWWYNCLWWLLLPLVALVSFLLTLWGNCKGGKLFYKFWTAWLKSSFTGPMNTNPTLFQIWRGPVIIHDIVPAFLKNKSHGTEIVQGT